MLMMYKLPLTLTINAKNLLSVRDIIYVISNNLQVILDESNLTSIKTMYTLVHIFFIHSCDLFIQLSQYCPLTSNISAIDFSSKANSIFPSLGMNTYLLGLNKAHEMVCDHSILVCVANKKLQTESQRKHCVKPQKNVIKSSLYSNSNNENHRLHDLRFIWTRPT